jgi:hypothetical protein
MRELLCTRELFHVERDFGLLDGDRLGQIPRSRLFHVKRNLSGQMRKSHHKHVSCETGITDVKSARPDAQMQTIRVSRETTRKQGREDPSTHAKLGGQSRDARQSVFHVKRSMERRNQGHNSRIATFQRETSIPGQFPRIPQN